MAKIKSNPGPFLIVAATATLLVVPNPFAWAQPSFAPPPSPTETPSAVRGIYSPSQVPQSPARVAPVTSPQTPLGTGTVPFQASSNVSPIANHAEELDESRILARVDGQIVMASDLLWQVNKLLELNRDRIPPDKIADAREGIMRQHLMGLIDTKILYADFRRTVPSENLPSIEKNLSEPFEESEIPRLIKMLDLNDQHELANFFADSGTSLRNVRQQFFERTIAGEWLRQLAPKPEPVSHEAMLAYYKEHAKEYAYPAQAKWEEVMIRFARVGHDRNLAYKKCAELGNEICNKVAQNPQFRGPAFEEFAKAKSHGFTADKGGQHDWTTKGALQCEDINVALFSLKIGQMSNIIESQSGFHIIRVLDRKEAGRTPFTEAQAKIRKILEKERQQGLLQDEMSKLRQKSRIWTTFDGNLSGDELSELLDGKRRR